MQCFNRDGKINFVDASNVVLGYDLQQDCCEHADWYVVDDEPQECDESKPEATSEELEGFNFDTTWFKDLPGSTLDAGAAVVFRATRGDEQKFLVLYNSHNGYYGHGFRFAQGNEALIEDTL